MLFRSRNGVDWMLVFLGNPGPKYTGTRHNVGFRTGDELARRTGADIRRLRSRALTAKAELAGASVLLVKPQTFMNLSGEAVRPLADYYRVPPERILVVCDEVALAPGKIRLRASGSAGGHNGMKSVIQHLGTDQFPRLRIGVGAPPNPEYDLADWVLGVPRGQDGEAVDSAVERAADAVECCIRSGLSKAMNLYNG